MSHDHAAVFARAARQLGLVTRAQLLDLGIPDRTIRAWVAAGRLRRVRPGVYLVPGAPHTWHVRVLAACLDHGGAASHLTAAAMHGAPGIVRLRPEVVVPNARRGGVTPLVHRTCHFDELEVRTVAGIPTVGPRALAVQLAGLVPERLPVDRFDAVVEHLVRHTDVSWLDLSAAASIASRRRMRGVAHLRSIVDEYLADDCESRLEREFLGLVAAHGLPDPVRQHKVVLRRTGRPVRLDFAYPAERVAIETDSQAHHTDPADVEADKDKRNELRSEGWIVYEVTKQMLRHRPARTAAEILASLAIRRAA